jgi:hypothetical protein
VSKVINQRFFLPFFAFCGYYFSSSSFLVGFYYLLAASSAKIVAALFLVCIEAFSMPSYKPNLPPYPAV